MYNMLNIHYEVLYPQSYRLIQVK